MVVPQNMVQKEGSPRAQPNRQGLVEQVGAEAHLNKTISRKMVPINKLKVQTQT